MGFPDDSCNEGDVGSVPGSGRSIRWRKKWQPTPVFLPRESHEQRSLTGTQKNVYQIVLDKL